jgi:polysaccharide biosynthesis/export protein
MVTGTRQIVFGLAGRFILAAFAASWLAGVAPAQTTEPSDSTADAPHPYEQTNDDYNRRLAELNRDLLQEVPGAPADAYRADYRIGPDDLLDITVLEASELDRSPRVSASGEISLALIGTVRAAGLTTRELETVIEELLRRSYIKDPHVSVQVKEMQSHSVAVFGAVKKPGVFQLRDPKTVVELLSMAEGLDVDAGDTVIVEHHADATALSATTVAPRQIDASFKPAAMSGSTDPATADAATNSAGSVEINLKKLLGTGDPRLNVLVYPGDVVKVPRAELVYVVGEVAKPGGFQLKSNEKISVLQAVALAEGLTHTSASSRSRIIRTDPATGKRQEIPIDLNKILAGKTVDPMLEPRDIVFVPNSTGRAALYRGIEAAISIGSGVAIYRP